MGVILRAVSPYPGLARWVLEPPLMIAVRAFWLGFLLAPGGCLGSLDPVGSSDGSPENAAECREIHRRPSCVGEAAVGCMSSPASLTITQPLTERPFARISPPYGSAECPDRALVDLEAKLVPDSGAWLHSLWDITQIDDAATCDETVVSVTAWREALDGQWKQWDDYRTIGFWREGACRTVLCGGGKLEQGGLNELAEFPWSWISVESARRIRISVAVHGVACEPKDILVAVADQP